MENQHRKIKGYRELSQEEVDLMNRIKAKGSELLAMQAELKEKLDVSYDAKHKASQHVHETQGLEKWIECDETAELKRFQEAEPQRWAAIGKTDIQTGIMALVRAVAQPSEC